MTDRVIELDGVCKRFKDVWALNGCSFTVRRGEVFGLIGPNGSGKTTCVRLLLGHEKHDSGRLQILGRAPWREYGSIASQVAVMFDQPGLFEDLTVAEYLRFYADMMQVPKSEVSNACSGALAKVGLGDTHRRRLKGFSKGMRQRVSLARCLLTKPRVLILDEPYDGTDTESRQKIVQMLGWIAREQGTAILVTSHNLAEIEQSCHRVAVLRNGRVMAVASPDSLRRDHSPGAVAVIRVESSAEESSFMLTIPGSRYDASRMEWSVDLNVAGLDSSSLLRMLLDHGVSIIAFRFAEASFLDAYLTITRENIDREGIAGNH